MVGESEAGGARPLRRGADPRCRGGRRPLARDRPRHRAAARARVAHRRARGPSRRARRSVGAGARGHVLRRAPPRLRVHVERARGGAAATATTSRTRAAFFLIDTTNPGGGAGVLPGPRRGRPRAGGPRRADRGAIANAGPRARDAFATMCEVAQRFAGWLDLGSGIQAALEYVFARWDGRGFPDARGDAIPLPMRLLHVARDISLFLSAAGPDEARAVVERRTGAAYEPRLAELAVRELRRASSPSWTRRGCGSRRSRVEPFPQIWIAGERVDAAFMAIAALTGLKSPWLREHSTGVAELAEAAAWRMGLPAASVTLVRRAALAHDLGRIGVSNAIWEKPGPLGFGEWERVRLHPHFTERAFAQSPALAPIGMLAGSHHERLDGSGYHRGTRGPALDQPARILAAADCYGAMREARPYRPALEAPAAEAELLHEAEAGPARRRSGRRGARRRGPPRAAATSRAAGRADRARAGSPPRARARRVQPGDRRRPRHLGQDRRAPRPARLREGRRPQPGRGNALGLRARSRSSRSFTTHRAFARCRSGVQRRTLVSPSAPIRGAETTKEESDDPGNDEGRGLRPLRADLLDQGRREAQAARLQGSRPSFAIPTRETASG